MAPLLGLPLTSLAETTATPSVVVDLNDERTGSHVACGLPSINKRQKGVNHKILIPFANLHNKSAAAPMSSTHNHTFHLPPPPWSGKDSRSGVEDGEEG